MPLREGAVTVGVRPEGFIPGDGGKLHCGLTAVEVMGRDTSIVATNAAAVNGSIRTIVSTEVIGTAKGNLLVAMMKFGLGKVDPEAGLVVLCEDRLPEVAVYE